MAINLQATCIENCKEQDFWQVMKFVKLGTTCTLTVLNMV